MTTRRIFLRHLTILSGGLMAACGAPAQTTAPEAGPTDAPSAAPPLPTQVPDPSESDDPTSIDLLTPNADGVIVLATGLDFPEGPAFDPQGNLWCTELNAGTILKLVDGQPVRYPIDGGPGGRGNGMAFDKLGRAWVADSGRNAIQRFDPANEQWETILDMVDNQPLQSPNDLCFDSAGNLLFTCPNFNNTDPTGYVVCLRPDGTAKKIVEGFYRPNGLDVVEGGKALVVADTYRKTLFKGAWDAASATWSDPRAWAEVGGTEGPDGMTPGADGLLYQAIYGDGVVRVVGPDGRVLNEIKVPGANPTNVAIDPSGALGIVITETEKGQLISLPGYRPGVAIFDGGDAW